MDLLEDLDGELPNKIARPMDGIYFYYFDKNTIHRAEIKDGMILWSEEYDLENERRKEVGDNIPTDTDELGEKPNRENGDPEKPFGARNQGSGCQ